MLLDALLNLLQGVRLDVTTAHKGKGRLVQPPTSFGRAYFCSSSFVFLEGRGVNH